jgi:anti-anti-sigma factor
MKVHETVYSTVVTFNSAVDAEGASRLKDVLSDIKSPVNDRLVMDMKASTYLSADAVCVLLSDQRNNNYNVEFKNVSKDVGKLLDTAGLGNLIVI